jgi:hypothetical protein
MSTVTMPAGGLARKDPADIKVFLVDWDAANLALGVTISTSTWTITVVHPVAAWDALDGYAVADVVLVGGVIYTCLLAHTNVTPPNATYWAVVATDAPLTKDSESILAGTRKTQVRLLAGTLGQIYEIANKIVTSETPAQTKERSFRVLIENL